MLPFRRATAYWGVPRWKAGRVTNQRVVIHYNCIGAFEVPDRRKIPETDIIMETRKGVALSYAPEQVQYELCEKYKSRVSITGYSDPIRTLCMVRVTGIEPAASWTPFFLFHFRLRKIKKIRVYKEFLQFLGLHLFRIFHIFRSHSASIPLLMRARTMRHRDHLLQRIRFS